MKKDNIFFLLKKEFFMMVQSLFYIKKCMKSERSDQEKSGRKFLKLFLFEIFYVCIFL